MEGLVQSLNGGANSHHGKLAPPMLRVALLVSVPALATLLTLLHYSTTNVWWLAEGGRLAAFEAAAPFQYRVLLPLLVAAVHAVSTIDVATLFAFTEIGAWILLVVLASQALRSFQVVSSELARWLLAMTVTIPVAAHLIPPDLLMSSLVSVEGERLVWGEWHVTYVFRYVYDLPAAVFTLALVLVLHRLVMTRQSSWLALYLGLFVLAVLNRETALFLVPVFFAVCFRVLDHRTLAGALLFQAGAVIAIQGTLQWLFAGNVNPHANVLDTQYENHLLNNLTLLAGPVYLAIFLVRFGAGLWLPVLRFNRCLDPFLARTLLWFGLPFLATTLFFGRIQEHRVMVELAPLLWLGSVQAIAAYRASRASPDGDTRSPATVRPTSAGTVEPERLG